MNVHTLSREQLQQLRNKGLRPKTQEDELRAALQSPLEQLQQQEQSLAGTAAQIKGTYGEKWFNALIQFAFKLTEGLILESAKEGQTELSNQHAIDIVNSAVTICEELRRREIDYKEHVGADAPIPETLTAGLSLIRQDIKAKLEEQANVNGMSLEKIEPEVLTELDKDIVQRAEDCRMDVDTEDSEPPKAA